MSTGSANCAPGCASGFNIRNKGHRVTAIAVLAFCAAAWAVQLGGVASLQAACQDDLHLDMNSMDDFKVGMANLQKLVLSINATAPAASPVQLKQSLAMTLSLFSDLAYRSTSIFTLTPDHKCSEFYRYQWLNTALQFVVLGFAFVCLFFNLLHIARVAICSLLTVSSVLAIENADTFFHVRQYAPDLTLQRGQVFFAGCVATCAANLLLLFILGIHDERAVGPFDIGHSDHQHEPRGSIDDGGNAAKPIV